MGLGKPGRLGVDQPTITGELGPAPDAYTYCSPVMIAALSKTAGRKAFDEGGLFFCAKQEAGVWSRSRAPPPGVGPGRHPVCAFGSLAVQEWKLWQIQPAARRQPPALSSFGEATWG